MVVLPESGTKGCEVRLGIGDEPLVLNARDGARPSADGLVRVIDRLRPRRDGMVVGRFHHGIRLREATQSRGSRTMWMICAPGKTRMSTSM